MVSCFILVQLKDILSHFINLSVATTEADILHRSLQSKILSLAQINDHPHLATLKIKSLYFHLSNVFMRWLAEVKSFVNSNNVTPIYDYF